MALQGQKVLLDRLEQQETEEQRDHLDLEVFKECLAPQAPLGLQVKMENREYPGTPERKVHRVTEVNEGSLEKEGHKGLLVPLGLKDKVERTDWMVYQVQKVAKETEVQLVTRVLLAYQEKMER